MKKSIPGPKALVPGLSGVLALARFARDPLSRMGALFERYGDVFVLCEGDRTRVFSSHPECRVSVFGRGAAFARRVELDSLTFHRSGLSGRVVPRGRTDARHARMEEWGTGLFVVNDDEHARHRRLLAPAFGRKSVEGWIPAMVEITDRVARGWHEGQRVDMREAMMEIALRIATRAFFGEEMSSDSALARAQEASLRALISPGVMTLPFDLPGLPYRRFLDDVVGATDEIRRIVALRRQEGASGSDLLSKLIRAAASDEIGMSDAQVVGHAGVTFAAGHETTANALAWTLFFLAQHPEVAAAAVDEVSSVLRGADPTLADLGELPVLDRAIFESLRLMPPAPWTSREAVRSTELCGYEIERGTEVIVSIYHTHRDPDVWSDARRFEPRRFEACDPNPYEYNPFGGGPRTCIGRRFALTEMRVVLAMLLERFRFEPCPRTPIDPSVSITTSLRHGLPMTLRKPDQDWERGWSRAPGRIHRYVDLRQD